MITTAISGSTSATAPALPTLGAGLAYLNYNASIGVRDNSPSNLSGAGGVNIDAMTNLTISVGASGGAVTYPALTLVGGNSLDIWVFALPASVVSVDEQEQMEIDDLRRQNDRLADRLCRIESMLNGQYMPPLIRVPTSVSDGFESPDESKESDMEKSIHLPRAVYAKLLGK